MSEKQLVSPYPERISGSSKNLIEKPSTNDHQPSILSQIIDLAMRAEASSVKKMNDLLEGMEQTSEMQKMLLNLKKELIANAGNYNQQKSEKTISLIQKLREQDVEISNDPTTEEIDLELEKIRTSVTNVYQKIENLGRDKNAIFDITKKIMENINRLIEKMLSRMNSSGA